jgi:hypothetical protein
VVCVTLPSNSKFVFEKSTLSHNLVDCWAVVFALILSFLAEMEMDELAKNVYLLIRQSPIPGPRNGINTHPKVWQTACDLHS